MAQPTQVKDARPAAHNEAQRLLAKARELAPFFSAQAAHNEAKGSLTDKTVAALREGGFFSTLVPRHFGGAEIWPLEASEIFEALSHADGATGWVLIVTQVSLGSVGAYLDLAAAQEIFANGIPLIAGQGGPQGQAVVDGHGFRLSGRWGYGSGVLHADYLFSGAAVVENGQPRMLPDGSGPDIRVFIVPRREVVFYDNWDVLGLRATASVDYAMTDVYVPEEFSFHPATTKPKQGGNLYKISVMGMVGIGHASYYLGVARSLLDELAKIATAKSPRPSVLSAKNGGESLHEQYGAAEAKLRAARALTREVWKDIEESIGTGHELSTRQTTLYKLALNHASMTAVEIANFAYKYGGGVALRAGALQRGFRDIHAGAQHILTSPVLLRECGRELLGAAQGEIWGPYGLIGRS
jgi:alkylation response protein AidB-like acyl-CoA dehydrogenase